MSDFNFNMEPINPMAGVMDSLKLGATLGGIRDQRADAQAQAEAAKLAAEKKAERDTRVVAAWQKSIDSPSGESYEGISTLLPEDLSDELIKKFAALDESKRSVLLREGMEVFSALQFGDVNLAKKILDEKANALRTAGNTKALAEVQTFRAMLENGEKGAIVVKGIYGTMASLIPGGKEAIDTAINLSKAEQERMIANKLAADQKEGTLDPDKAFGYEMQLNNTVNTRLAASRESETLYQNIKAGADMKDGVGDMAIINMFMRQLSPGIVTGEDYAAATKSGGILSELLTLKGKVAAGELMTDPQRTKFVSLSKQFMENAKKQNEQQLVSVKAMVKNYGLNPENVFGTMADGTATPAAATPAIVYPNTFEGAMAFARERNKARPDYLKELKSIKTMAELEKQFLNTMIDFRELQGAGQTAAQGAGQSTEEVDF